MMRPLAVSGVAIVGAATVAAVIVFVVPPADDGPTVRARRAFEAAEYAACDSLAAIALHKSPDDVEALVLRARALVALDRSADAMSLASNPGDSVAALVAAVTEPDFARVAALAEVVSRRPGFIVARVMLSEERLRHGDAGAALVVLDFGPRGRRHYSTRMAEGEASLALGEAARALAAFESAQEIDPGSAQAAFGRGEALELLGRGGDAGVAYRRALRLRGRFPEARVKLGHVLRASGRHAEAYAQFSAAVREDPDDAAARAGLALALLSRDRPDEARDHLVSALAIAPHDPDVLSAWGVYHLESGDPQSAVAAFNSVLNARPNDRSAWRLLARALVETGKTKPALDAYSRAFDGVELDADAHLEWGAAFQADGRLDAAASHFLSAVYAEPTAGRCKDALGYAYFELGMWQDAIGLLKEAAVLSPRDPSPRAHLGELYFAQGMYTEAEASFAAAVRLDSTYAPAWIALGRLYDSYARADQSGAWADTAQACLMAAVRHDPRSFDAALALGSFYEGRKRWGDALTWYGKASLISPNSADVYNGLGNVEQVMGYFARAASSYRRAIELDPESFDAYYNLGYVLDMQDKYDEALGAYKKAAALRPDEPDVRYNLAVVYEKMDLPAMAVMEYRAYLALAPNAGDAAAVRRRIRELGG